MHLLGRRVTRTILTLLAATALVLGFSVPATAAAQWDKAYWSPDVTVSCPKGKFGYFYIQGGHVSHKRIYWKTKVATHWSNTLPTGWNGEARLVRVLPKRGQGRTARAYFGAAPDSRHGMSPRSELDYFGFCDRRNLYYAENASDVHFMKQSVGVWAKAQWRMLRWR